VAVFEVLVELVDSDDDSPYYFEVTTSGSKVLVKAHMELSEIEVRKACQDLGELSDVVYAAWRSRVGLDPLKEAA